MKTSALIFDKIKFQRGDFRLGADSSFHAGKLTVILGPSGSGKTTMLDLAAGFLRPCSGTILEGDRDVTLLSPDKRKVGVVFQDHALFPHLSVMDNVAYGPRVSGAGKLQSRKVAGKYLEMTQISRYASRKPSSLSGGEKQRVSLARALAIEPEILLLDEPFSSLDASLRKNLRNEVRRIQKETGITAVLVTHDQEEALSLADNLAVMREGQIVQMGKPGTLWKNPEDLFTAMFLGRSTRLSVRSIGPLVNGFNQVETSAGSILVENRGTLPELPAAVIIRPEDLKTAARASLSGTVKEIQYAGGHWKLQLSTTDETDVIDCDFHDTHPPEIGDHLSLEPGRTAARLLHIPD